VLKERRRRISSEEKSRRPPVAQYLILIEEEKPETSKKPYSVVTVMKKAFAACGAWAQCAKRIKKQRSRGKQQKRWLSEMASHIWANIV
jgi:hypothetical protein